MLIKEFIQILRDPRMKAVIFVTPVLQLLVFGSAVTTDITEIPTAVADFDRSQETREIVRRFEHSGYFRVVRRLDDAGPLTELLDRGTVKAALRFDTGFATDLHRGRTAHLQIVVDGTDSNTANVVMDYANRIVAQYNREAARAAMAAEQMAAGSFALLKGNGPDVLWPQMLALFVLGTAVFTVSTLRFRKRID